MSQRGNIMGWDIHRYWIVLELLLIGTKSKRRRLSYRTFLLVGTQHARVQYRTGRRNNLPYTKRHREGTYRSGGAWGDVEERHPILGALRNGEVFWDCVKRLQMNQHLICLVDAEREEAVSHTNPCSPLQCLSHPVAARPTLPVSWEPICPSSKDRWS